MSEPTAALPRVNRCRTCQAEGPGLVLHHDPASTGATRTICGTCQGLANRRILDAHRPRPARDGDGDGRGQWNDR